MKPAIQSPFGITQRRRNHHHNLHKLIATAIILFVVYTLVFRNREWGPAPLVWLGTISFSLYLMHTLVMYAGEASGLMQWMKQYPPTLYFLVVIAISIAISYLSWLLIERPFQRFARRMTPWEHR